jgi:hypothetical protein
MTARRKPSRQRDMISFGRRTPRFNLVSLREEVQETSKLAKVISPVSFADPRRIRSSKENPFILQ